MWLRECWQVAAFSDEVQRTVLARRVVDEAVVLFRATNGVVTALADRCAHRGVPLSLGRVVEDGIQCGYHGMCFDASGRCIVVPGQETVPDRAVVRSYPIVERNRLVWIWMGDPANAEPDFIPDVHWFDDPEWTAVFGYLHVAADYRLLVDNLLDLSHETFVHGDTIGNRAVADSPVTASIVGGTAQAYRFMANCEPSPLVAHSTAYAENIDRWHKTIYTPPGYCLIENGSKPAGSQDPGLAKEGRVVNLITPETMTTSHYFWGFARSYKLGDAAVSEHLRDGIVFTFDQDKVLLEAQQRSLGTADDDAFPVTIKVDAGPVLGRRVLARALDEQARCNRSIA